MKKLLVLTDFTQNAAHAATVGAHLCKKLGTDLLLYHTIQYMPVIPNYSGNSFVTETADVLYTDSAEKLELEAGRLRSLVEENTGYKPKIDFAAGEGSLGQNIRELSDGSDILFIVMGGRTGGTLDHWLTGSETTGVISSAKKPVLIVPQTANLNPLKKIIFATDFAPADIPALHFLLNLAQSLEFEIEVVHVVHPDEVITEIQQELDFRDFINQLHNPAVSYTQLFDNHTARRLETYCNEIGAGMLAMTHGHHNWLSRKFGYSESRSAIKHLNLAVMIFPTT